MKVRKPFMYALAITTVAAAGVTLTSHYAGGSFDLPGLNQQVQRQGEQLNNHEVRINNLEGDVGNLQQNTKTGAAPHQTPPPVVTPAPQSTPEPTPAPTTPYVTNSEHFCGTDNTLWVRDHYSDGNTKEYAYTGSGSHACL